MIDPQDAALVPRHVRLEALYEAEQAVSRVLERHGIHRDLFGRFKLLDLALDEAEAETQQRNWPSRRGTERADGGQRSGYPPEGALTHANRTH